MLRPALITCLCCFTSLEGLPPWKDDLRIGNPLRIIVEPCSWSQGRRPIVDCLSLYFLSAWGKLTRSVRAATGVMMWNVDRAKASPYSRSAGL